MQNTSALSLPGSYSCSVRYLPTVVHCRHNRCWGCRRGGSARSGVAGRRAPSATTACSGVSSMPWSSVNYGRWRGVSRVVIFWCGAGFALPERLPARVPRHTWVVSCSSHELDSSSIPTRFSWNLHPCCRFLCNMDAVQKNLQHGCTWYKSHKSLHWALQRGCNAKKSAIQMRCRA